MKQKSLIIFIVAIFLILAGTAVGTTYIFTKKDAPLITAGDEPYEETIVFEDMVPGGEKYVAKYTTEGGIGSVFSARFSGGGEGTLSEFLTVEVVVAGETVYSGSYAECAENAITKEVTGDFEFTVSFWLDASVGDEAQGLTCEIIAEYGMEGDSQG